MKKLIEELDAWWNRTKHIEDLEFGTCSQFGKILSKLKEESRAHSSVEVPCGLVKKCPHYGDGVQSNEGCPGSINTRHCPDNTNEDCDIVPQAPKQQDGLSKEYPWLEDGPNWKDLIMLHRETQAAYHAAKGKAADSPECEDFRVKVKRSAREWLRIYNPLIYPQSAKPVEPLAGCNMCGSKKVFIRGKYPKEPDREICPCCLVEKLEDMVSNFNITASCERPDTGEDKGGGV